MADTITLDLAAVKKFFINNIGKTVPIDANNLKPEWLYAADRFNRRAGLTPLKALQYFCNAHIQETALHDCETNKFYLNYCPDEKAHYELSDEAGAKAAGKSDFRFSDLGQDIAGCTLEVKISSGAQYEMNTVMNAAREEGADFLWIATRFPNYCLYKYNKYTGNFNSIALSALPISFPESITCIKLTPDKLDSNSIKVSSFDLKPSEIDLKLAAMNKERLYHRTKTCKVCGHKLDYSGNCPTCDYGETETEALEESHGNYSNQLDLSNALMSKNLSIKLVRDQYGYDGPIETGGFYIMPDGTAVKSTNHADIDKFLIRKGLISGKVEDYGGGSQFMDAINCVRLRRRGGKDSWILPYCILPKEQLTQVQYSILRDWIDFVLKNSGELELETVSGEHKIYHSDADIADVMMDIHRFYRTAMLEGFKYELYDEPEIDKTDYELLRDIEKGYYSQF